MLRVLCISAQGLEWAAFLPFEWPGAVSSSGQQFPWSYVLQNVPLTSYFPVVCLYAHVSLCPQIPLPYQYLCPRHFTPTSPHSSRMSLSPSHGDNVATLEKKKNHSVWNLGPSTSYLRGTSLCFGFCVQDRRIKSLPASEGCECSPAPPKDVSV